VLHQQFDDPADADLFIFREGIEPAGEPVSALNLPSLA
jgi:hypothetical protein